MSLFFKHSSYGEDPSANLFRVLDDIATYLPELQALRSSRPVPAFSPKFDVRETATSFELHGELPGIDRENLSIEFTEPQSLVIRGRVERNYSAGIPPAAAVEDKQTSGASTEGTAEASHQASVSDKTEAAPEKGDSTPASTKASTAVTAPAKTQASPPKERYWHQERSIGEFHRTFNFHTRLDPNGVQANLDRGVLHVTIPKAPKHEPRRIAIN